MPAADLYSFEISGHEAGREIRARISINEHSQVYAGHFPGFPVTPGVCQVQMIKDILLEVLEIPLQLSKARDIKFNTMHEPGKVRAIDARITYEPAGEKTVKVTAQLFDGNTKYLSFRGEVIAHE